MNDKLKAALYDEATTNGLSAHEYRILLGDVERRLDEMVSNSMESVHGITPNAYDIEGMPA